MAEDLGTIELEFTGGEPAQVRRAMRQQGESISGGLSSGASKIGDDISKGISRAANGIGIKIAAGILGAAALGIGVIVSKIRKAFETASAQSQKLAMFSPELLSQRVKNDFNEFFRQIRRAKTLGPLFAEFERQKDLLRENTDALRNLWDALRVQTLTVLLELMNKLAVALRKFITSLLDGAQLITNSAIIFIDSLSNVLPWYLSPPGAQSGLYVIREALAEINEKVGESVKLLRDTRDSTEASTVNEFMLQDFNFMAERNIVPGIVTPGLPMPAAP